MQPKSWGFHSQQQSKCSSAALQVQISRALQNYQSRGRMQFQRNTDFLQRKNSSLRIVNQFTLRSRQCSDNSLKDSHSNYRSKNLTQHNRILVAKVNNAAVAVRACNLSNVSLRILITDRYLTRERFHTVWIIVKSRPTAAHRISSLAIHTFR